MLYVDFFFNLRNHPEWQKGCLPVLLHLFMLALEKERAKDRRLKQCCSSCSIRHRCLKCSSRQEEDDVKMVVPDAGDMEIEDLFVSDTGGAQGGGGSQRGARSLFQAWWWGGPRVSRK